jgi:PKD repeat protein
VLVGGPGNVYPSNNFFPTLMALVGFVDLAGGNYRLGPISFYCHAATDGTDVGVNFDALQAAIGGQTTGNQPPQASIAATPVSGTTPLNVTFTSIATDPDGSIVGYNWNFGDGQSATGPAPSHLYQSAGNFTAQLTVTDNGGATATRSIVISATTSANPPATAVLYASEAPVRVGNWQVVTDATAAGGARLWNPDLGTNKINTAAATPASYFEMTFNAQANTAYHLWMRGKAQNDSPYNDSVHVQFSDSVNATGASVFRIGTTDSTVINLEDDLSYGVKGWGWQDNGWGVGVMGPNLYFAATGTHTLRVQVREDGFSIDQIVLSPSTYLNASPGALKNDTVILPKTPVGLALMSDTPDSGTAAGGMTVNLNGAGFLSGATVKFGDAAAVTVNVVNNHSMTAVTPAHTAGRVDVTVINPDGASATLSGGYTYLPPNHAPQVSPTASVTTGVAPLNVNFAANATDADGDTLNVTWEFGDGQTAAGASVSHTYMSGGQFTARVTAKDPAGAMASATLNITASPGAGPVIQVLTPLAAQKAQVKSFIPIIWTADRDTLMSQTIQLSLDGGLTWRDVMTDLSGDTRLYLWRVPNLPTNTARIRVIAYDRGGAQGAAMNPGNFLIGTKFRTQKKANKP